MKKPHLGQKIFIFLEAKLRNIVLYILSVLFFSTSFLQPAIANSISGTQLKKLIIQELTSIGVISDPAINDKRLFTGCVKENIEVTRRDPSWNTLKLSCKNNKYWSFNFRNKIFKKNSNETGFISLKNKYNSEEKIQTTSFNEKNLVFVLTNSKYKDETLDKEDVRLELRKKISSKGSFSELKYVLGKKLKRSLKKGSILKEKHLKEDWLVHKNQKIEIVNQVGSVKVSMKGLALSNGLKGDRILVKNLSSNKTVEGFVKSEKKISIFRKIY